MRKMFNTDKPINNISSDLLNRASFSEQLAKAILSYTNTDNFTISLCGKWGSGKTSILNMVETYINTLTQNYSEDEKPIIVHFNPWNYSDQTQLITQFFSTMLAELNVNSKSESLYKVGKALQEYSTVFEYAENIPVAGKYIKPIKWIMEKTGKRLSNGNDNNLNKKKEEVTKALSHQSHKFIVIIDDIDRLNNNQIKLIFQLVNSLAGFPNLIYLLSFDREVVVRALSEEQKCNGEEYLEKIIQVPFNIPEAKGDLVQSVFFEKLNKLWFGEIPCSNFEKSYWDNVFNYCISPFIKSIRDVNRIINVYQFKYSLMHDETNCIDLLAITTLQICASSIYNWIYKNTDSICGSIYTRGISGVEQKEAYSKRLKEFQEIYDNPELMIQIVQTLFPKFSWLTGGYHHSGDSDDELRKKQKIACRTRAGLYFNLSLDDVAISKQEILESINDFDRGELNNYFNKLIKNDKMLEYSRELLSYVPDIPENRKSIFLNELIIALTIPSNHKSRGIFNPTPSTFIANCIWKIMKTYSQDEAEQRIIELINSYSSDELSIVVYLVLQIEYSYGRIGKDIDYNYRMISEEQLSNLERIIIDKLIESSKTLNLFDLTYFYPTYIFWHNIDKDSLDIYVKKELRIPSNIPKYLKITANHWSSGQGNGWSFQKDNFEGVLSDEDAYNSIVSLKSTQVFSKLDDDAKKLAIAYCLWYERKDEKLNRVDEDEVNKYLSEWEYETQ